MKHLISEINKLKRYAKEVRKLRQENSSQFHLWPLIRFYPSWTRSLNGSKTPLKDVQPWIAFGAIRFLEKHLHEDMHVFEYGIGGSTLFFAKRVKAVVSIEHDKEWYE
ncbi:hypothetical protein QUF75_01435 [Desulfococcaceae bacterium HSG7]|nr:hypothetical protein [Desulfococcaceae bacterium HSG7]